MKKRSMSLTESDISAQPREGVVDKRCLTLDPMTLEEVLLSIEAVGRATASEDRASSLVRDLRQRLNDIAAAVTGQPRPRIAMLEWTDPPFSSGHWVPDLVTAAGAESVLGISGSRSSQVTWADLSNAHPDIIVVTPCGFRLDGAQKLADELVAAGVLPANIPVWAVDADAAFVRPGPRLIEGVQAIAHIAHPSLVEAPEGMQTMVRS
jgi:iron complex transport system substrate-binding protein